MKILIITFTGGLNPGTFMQALGVQAGLKKVYPDAHIDYLQFPDFKRVSAVGVRGKKDAFWHTILQKIYAFYRLQKYNKLRSKYFRYTPAINLFNYSADEIEFIHQYDLVVIGSDTILEQAYSEDGKIGLNWCPLDIKKVYFAASASPALFEPKSDLKKIVSEARYIGLRDALTINFFKNKLGIEECRLIKQPDPSFFLDIETFKSISVLAKKLKKGQKYILYNFNSNFPLRKELANGLRSVGYKVVTTAYNPYADICFDTIDAFEWAGVFPLVDMIVTERFHDSVFGLRNEKPVIAVDWDSNRFAVDGDSKTLRILEDYGHQHLHFNLCGTTNISPIIDAVKNIHLLFNKAKVQSENDKIKQRLQEILAQVKDSVR